MTCLKSECECSICTGIMGQARIIVIKLKLSTCTRDDGKTIVLFTKSYDICNSLKLPKTRSPIFNSFSAVKFSITFNVPTSFCASGLLLWLVIFNNTCSTISHEITPLKSKRSSHPLLQKSCKVERLWRASRLRVNVELLMFFLQR